ncbi:beta-N-acetylhexosaminidase [Gracilibacillus phocaeensis]|uniref:beta-N-acetylhexosaminidase n=1 Tax=Gracilibacillus phocaeensis TaxID=2042304 RepID=UPI00102FDE24|nr:beta-N-acetylhexosaminidase [Gracilibacillus phocaeensis]
MSKRVTRFVFLAVIVCAVAWLTIRFIGNDPNEQVGELPGNTATDEEGQMMSNPEAALEEVFRQAEQGKVADYPFVVGVSTGEEVEAAWGAPDHTSDTDVGRFLEYSEQQADVGMTEDTVTDIRAAGETLSAIDLEMIQSYQQPDDTRYYQDEDHDQVILVYELDNGYVLKWVLPEPTDQEANPSVDHISLSKEMDETEEMSLDEKIGQMIFSGVDGTEITEATTDMIQSYHVGGIILFGPNIENREQTTDFLDDIKGANAENEYPLLLGVDEEGGSVTRMPEGINSLPDSRSIGALNDPDLSYEVGTILAEQMRTLGFNLDFAPVLDVDSNPNNPVIGDRSFGDNPDIVSNLGIQTMKGIQENGVISVVKHFPGHGDTGVDSHLELPKVDKNQDELAELELIPFQNAIAQGADMVMIAHILLPQMKSEYPASMSKSVITDMLREDIGFNGVVVTDDLTMGAITDHYSIAEAAVQSVKAGGDLLLVAHQPEQIATVVEELKSAVENGEISEERIDQSVERIIQLKEKYQLSDSPTPEHDIESVNEHVETIREVISSK